MIETSDTYKRLRAANAGVEVTLAIGRGPELAQEDGKTLVFGGTAICAGPDPAAWLREDQIESITVTQRAVGSGEVSVGNALSGEIDVTLLADADMEIPRQARLRPYVRLTDGTETSEWIPQGVFFLDTRETDSPDGLRKLTLHGYDAMLRGEQDYAGSRLGWPAGADKVVLEIAGMMGVQVDERTARLLVGGPSVLNPTGYSCREILAEIAGMYGGSFAISAEGKLLLVPIWGLDDGGDIDLSDDILGDYSTDEAILWGRVELALDDVVSVTAGNSDLQTLRIDCRSGTLPIARRLATQLENGPYQPFSAKTVLLDPAAELGDRLRLPGKGGVLLSATRYLGPMYTADLENPGDEDLTHEYGFSTVQDRAENRRYQSLRTDLDALRDTIWALSSAK